MYVHTSYSSFSLFFVMSAVDLQSCGVTSSGAMCLQELVDVNRSLVVLDLRANELIGGGSNLNRMATCTRAHTHTHTHAHAQTHVCTHFSNPSALAPLALLPLCGPVIPVCAVQP